MPGLRRNRTPRPRRNASSLRRTSRCHRDHAETDLPVVAHICMGPCNVLALSGDPVGGPAEVWEPHPGGVRPAEDLVRLLHEEGDFCVDVAAYPLGQRVRR